MAPPPVGPNQSFVFEIERCHLTFENYYDRRANRADEGECPRYDIAEALWFRGMDPPAHLHFPFALNVSAKNDLPLSGVHR